MTLEKLGLPERNGIRQGRDPKLSMSHPEASEGHKIGSGLSEVGPFLGLHPGSGSERKNWPKENFLEVARGAFRLWGLASVVLIGPAEEGQREFWTKAREPFLSVREGLSILEAAHILRRATLYVGNDSGITHLAAALGVPVIALFGPTDPRRWAPRGDRVEIRSQEISVQDLLAVLGSVHSSIIL
jgi:ADP-heptose:LPS heptosyltransferase